MSAIDYAAVTLKYEIDGSSDQQVLCAPVGDRKVSHNAAL